MNQQVFIKGNKYGITIFLDKTAPFERLKEALKGKLKESMEFFGSTKLALSFEGRKLTTDEQWQLLKIIETYSQLDIVCILDEEKEEAFRQAVEETAGRLTQQAAEKKASLRRLPPDKHLLLDDCFLGNQGQFYKGTLHEGEVVESEHSVVVLGNIELGAKLIVRGNIVVLGALKGYAYAGAGGDSSAFIAATQLETSRMRIGNVSFHQAFVTAKEPMIAAVERGHIHIRSLMMC